jgi:hypothetical protein
VSIGRKVPRYDRGITLAGAEFARSAVVGLASSAFPYGLLDRHSRH